MIQIFGGIIALFVIVTIFYHTMHNFWRKGLEETRAEKLEQLENLCFCRDNDLGNLPPHRLYPAIEKLRREIRIINERLERDKEEFAN